MLSPMKTTTLTLAVSVVALASSALVSSALASSALVSSALVSSALVSSGGLTSPGSPADPPAPKGAALDTSFLKQYAETRGFTLGRPQKPKITPDGKAVLFLRAEATTPKMKLYEFEVATGKTKELLSSETLLKGADENLTPEEKARRERQRVSVGGFADFALSPDGQNVLVKLSNRLYLYSRPDAAARELKTGTDGAIVDPKWAPDSGRVAYVRGFDLYVFDIVTWKEQAVTTGGTVVKTHGLAEFVAQEEMHRFSGFWWSPDSKQIAYEEADHTGVETWYVADPLKPEVKPQEQFYPRPGKQNVSVRLGVKPVAGGETVWVEWDRAKYEYLAQVAWGTGTLFVVLQSRDQKEVAFAFADPKTGKTEVTRRTRAKDGWLRVPSEPRLGGPVDDGKTFLLIADDEDGEPRLINHGRSGTVVLQTVPPIDILALPTNRVRAYVTSRGFNDPTYQHMVSFRFTQPNAPFIWNPDGPGFDTAAISDDETLLVLTSTTLKLMPKTTVRGLFQVAQIRELPSIATEPPFAPNVTIQKVGDGEGYWTGICRPRNFDPKKKYPVVVYTYGGPTSKVVTQEMQPWLLRQWVADQGFIVVAIDNRGTSGRGRDWEKAVYQKFGTVPLDDQVKGLHALCDKFPELDRDRVGIVGGSFGGYMAANGVLRRPDVFKAAVAMAPVTDWADYDTHYTERYMGLLPESKRAYDEGSLLPLAKGLRRPLLLIHGTADDNVYYRHTLRLTDALVRAGRDFEVLPLPGVTHMISRDPVVERVWAKTATFFKANLGEPK